MTSDTETVVVADANVLINLIHVSRLGLCADLPGLSFMVPDHVSREIRRPGQRAQLDDALNSGALQLCSISDPEDLGLFADLIVRLGRGEAACLVLAKRYGWTIASDEKGRFRKEAVKRLGKHRLIGTPDLFVRAIQAELVTVEEADSDKATLEGQRFRMAFKSFREKLEAADTKPRGGSTR